nr:YifB family Mg chelatase-like AAA ATPase [Ruania albidiflava]
MTGQPLRAARALSVAVVGLEGLLVEVESALHQGLPGVQLIGLPDTAAAEARERVRAAVIATGLTWPSLRLVVNLRPADVRKSGSAFDVAVAVAVLLAAGLATDRRAENRVHLGELGLDGTVHPVHGVLPAVAAAVAAGHPEVVVPSENVPEAELVPGARVTGVRHLSEVAHGYGAEGVRMLQPVALERSTPAPVAEPAAKDLADVIGQEQARHALEVAAAGGHHLFLSGPPGAGKSMLAARLPSLLPDLDDAAAVEVTTVHSVAGTYRSSSGLIRRPPYEAPHHTASKAAIIGGGSRTLQPGAVVRAHRGVLLLDEAAEFPRTVLDTLRQPIEEGQVVLARASQRAIFPCRVQLVLAANPCPCGWASGKALRCRCTPKALRDYAGKLSGPLLDRVDIRVDVAAVPRAQLLSSRRGETSATVAARVAAARAAQAERWKDTPWRTNAEVDGPWLRDYTGRIDPHLLTPLKRVADTPELSMRGVDRVVRVAWTLADLHGLEHPGPAELGAALTLRNRDLDA